MEQDTARQEGTSSSLSRRTLASICYTSLVRNMTTAMMHGGDIGPDQNIPRTRDVFARACVRACVNAGCSRYRWDRGPSDHAISAWTAGRCSKYWIRIIEMRSGGYYVCLSARVLSGISRTSIRLTKSKLRARDVPMLYIAQIFNSSHSALIKIHNS